MAPLRIVAIHSVPYKLKILGLSLECHLRKYRNFISSKNYSNSKHFGKKMYLREASRKRVIGERLWQIFILMFNALGIFYSAYIKTNIQFFHNKEEQIRRHEKCYIFHFPG